jgi:hypothetical protein
MRWLAIVLALCATASADPPKPKPTLRLERQPPRLRMRPRAAAVTPPSTPAPAAPATPPPDADLGVLRDVARPIAARFSLGYVVDGTTLTNDKRFNPPQAKSILQERAYALGQGYLSTQGVILPSLSTYLAAQFQIVNQPTGTATLDGKTIHPELRPPVATWFDRNGIEPRNLWAEVKDFLPDPRFAPLRVRAGELYVYGPWVMHMYGANASWEAKLVHAGVYVGTRVPDYTLHDVAAKDRALITGASLRIDLRDLRRPIPFAIAGEVLGLASLGSATGESSRHAQLEIDWRPRKDVVLIGQARTRDAQLANEHVQLRSRYGQVTNLVFDLTHRHDADWRWDPTVTDTDPLAAKRYLDLGPVLPQLLASVRAGTLIKENIDLYVRGAAATDLQPQDGTHSTFAANYLEVGGALEVRLRRTISLGASGLTRETKRYPTAQIIDVPRTPQMLPGQSDPSIGENSMTELGATLRMSLGARKFSATAEGYGRRTEYASVYCVTQTAMCDPTNTGIPAHDVRWGGRATIDAWIGQKLRVFASYELSSAITFQPWISGYKSLQLVMEGIY